MVIIFNDPELADLYEGKSVASYRSNPQLINQFVKTVKKLQALDKVEQIYQFHSLHYEKLKGNLKGLSSVRINKQYRLLFTEKGTSNEPEKITMFAIEEISKHYE